MCVTVTQKGSNAMNKTIMSKERTGIFRQDFQERHEKAFVKDINSLSVAINSNFPNEKVTVWHCCTSNGCGYYTISNGEMKRFVRSEYRLECVGGVWSLHVYERLYLGQVNLIKFLEAVRTELCKRFSVEMPLRTLYIAHILTDLEEWQNKLKDEYCHEDDKRNFEIARYYQNEFKKNYAEEIKSYNQVLSDGGSFLSYYNGKDNYEYSCVSLAINCEEFLNRIDINKLSKHKEQYLHDYKCQFAFDNALFKLNSAKGIPKEIQQLDFHGYCTEIKENGFSRYVDYDLNALFITYKPFDKICIDQNGTFKTNTWKSTGKKIIFSNMTQEFITGYETKKGFKYKPTQLKELFLAISIHDTDEDVQNAYSVINFLCQKYDTYIFRDLYNDFLQSDGLLLPLLITETAQYRTKQELFDKRYHMPINGKWNKKNANLTYLILKLRPRMTDEALARAMQCKNALKIKKVGKRRYIMTYIRKPRI